MLSSHLFYVILPVVSKTHTSLTDLLKTAITDKTVTPSLALSYCLLRMVELEIGMCIDSIFYIIACFSVREKTTIDSCIENLLIVISKSFHEIHEKSSENSFPQISEKEVSELLVEAGSTDVDEMVCSSVNTTCYFSKKL